MREVALSRVIPKLRPLSATDSSDTDTSPLPSVSALLKASMREVLLDSSLRERANRSSVSFHAYGWDWKVSGKGRQKHRESVSEGERERETHLMGKCTACAGQSFSRTHSSIGLKALQCA